MRRRSLVLLFLIPNIKFNEIQWQGGLSILKPEDRFKEYERSVQLSHPLSLPEVELQQQQFVYEIRKEKEFDIKLKRQQL